MADVDFKVFSGAANMKGGRVVALRVPGGSQGRRHQPRRDRCLHRVRQDLRRQGPGLHPVNELAKGRDGLQSPIVKNIHDKALPPCWSAPARRTAT
jgi:aspartyl-tRNA synthetase